MPMERITLPPAPLREARSLLESSPAGWTSVQPGPDLAGWTRGPWPPSATLGPQQWSVDPATGHLVCDGQGGHEWLRYDQETGDAVFHVEWRFAPVEGADKYNSGVIVRTAVDLSVWHQAQVGLKGGFLFGPTPVDGVVKRVTQEPAAQRVLPAGEWNTYEVVGPRPHALALGQRRVHERDPDRRVARPLRPGGRGLADRVPEPEDEAAERDAGGAV